MTAVSARGERGSAIVAVLGVVLALLLLGGAALSLADRRLGSSARERDAARAAAAADAAADVAGLRMNRALGSTGVAELAGLPAEAVARLGCVSVAVRRVEIGLGDGDWCPASAWEDLGDGASFQYTIGTQVQLLRGRLVERRVVATGRAGGLVRRVLVTYELDLDARAPARLFRRARYALCTATAPAGRADGGCPDPARAG